MIDWLTVVISILGALIVAIITPYLTYKLNVNYLRRKLNLEKKLEYFTKLAEQLEEESSQILRLIRKLDENNEKEIQKVCKQIRELISERDLSFRAAPTTFFRERRILDGWISLSYIKEDILKISSNLSLHKKKEERKKNLILIKQHWKKLVDKSQEIIVLMKKELGLK